MATKVPGFWTVWLLKSGIWALVILFGFFYLGSVERQGGDIGVEPGSRPESAPGAVSQVEAEAFAQAVMNDAVIRPALKEASEAPPAEAVIARSALAPADLKPSLPVATSRRSMVDVSGSGLNAARGVVPESPAQQRAKTIAEHLATHWAVREEMRRRWSGIGGAHPYRGYPYATYPQWGYPPGIPPQGASTAR